MPAWSELVAQPERYQGFGICSDIAGRPNPRMAPRAAGSGAGENSNLNTNLGAKSGWQGRLSNSNNSQPLQSRGSALGDITSCITNIAACQANQTDNGKLPIGKQTQQLLQQPAASTLPEPSAAERSQADEHEDSNPQSVQEYAPDIKNHLFREELVCLPRPDYMDSQTDISPKMRAILIDWLVEVHMKHKLCPETLHLTVNLIDRYLATKTVMRKSLQLIGVVALFIASKFEDIRPPELHEMVYITDNAYKKEDVLSMECTMLTTLNFKIVVPTTAHFFEVISKTNGCAPVHREVVQYLLHLALMDIGMLKHSPSHLVAAALLLSNELLKRKVSWPAAMVQQSHHTEQSLQRCADELRLLLDADSASAGGQLQAVHKKFSLGQHHAVAKMKF